MIEKRIAVAAAPATIFRIYQDVEHWNVWDPDTRSAWLESGLVLGSTGRLTPTRGRAVPMQVTSLEVGRHFTVSSRTPLFRIDFKHELIPFWCGTKVVHRIRFFGLLKGVLARLLGPGIDAGLPETLRRLKALAEAKARQGNAGLPA